MGGAVNSAENWGKGMIGKEKTALGGSDAAAPTIPGMPAAPDLTDAAVLAARRAAMRQLAVKRGLQSTFVTTPQAGSMLGGSGSY